MPTIAEVRQQYPQYSDMSDEALASSLHKKYYADMPFEDFAGKVGLNAQRPNLDAKTGPDSYSGTAIAKDMWQQGKQELKNAVTGLAGTPRWLADRFGEAGAGLVGLAGGSPETAETVRQGTANSAAMMLNPVGELTGTSRTEDMNNIAERYMGPDQNAQTWQGRATGDVASMAAGAIGPGGPIRKFAQVALPGITSFAAGEATEGSSARPFAKAAGALAGGLSAGTGAKRQAVNAALKASPFDSQPVLNDTVNNIYTALRDKGATYDADSFGRMAGRLGETLTRAGIMQADAPKTWERVNMILEGAKAGRRPSWDEINSMRTGLGNLLNDAVSGERAASGKVFSALAQFEKTADVINAAGKAEPGLAKMAARARELALRNIKAKEFGKREANAETYTSGIESGLRNQTANMLRSKYGTRLFKNKGERDQLLNVTAGGAPRKALAAFGKLGFDFSRLGNANSVIPGIGLAAAGGYGYGTGDWENAGKAAAVMGAGSLAKMGARKLTERDAKRAMNIILAGPKVQRDMVLAAKGAKRDQMLRAVLSAYGASQPVRGQP